MGNCGPTETLGFIKTACLTCSGGFRAELNRLEAPLWLGIWTWLLGRALCLDLGDSQHKSFCFTHGLGGLAERTSPCGHQPRSSSRGVDALAQDCRQHGVYGHGGIGLLGRR